MAGANTSNLCVPFYEPSSRITGRAFGAAVVGKTFVMVAGKKDPGSRELDPGATGGNVLIAPAAAADAKTLGVAEHDADEGKTTAVLCGGFTVPVTAATAITAGDLVNAGANGQAAVAADLTTAKGLALADAAAGSDAIVKLF
jgi:predicted RecA/RadA family phage recombinase